jgi:DNA-binding HxlR family transcriptional regulator
LWEEVGIIIKTKRPDKKKANLYLLTDKGLALKPILAELATWSDSHLRDIHPTIVNGESLEFLRNDKATFAKNLEEKYKEKLANTM